MNKRLVWNFEIEGKQADQFPHLPPQEREDIRWEARFFWQEESIITLHGLGEDFLNLGHYQCKQRLDKYHLLEDFTYNIKFRREELVYKPLLAVQGTLQGFGKKIDLQQADPDNQLAGEPAISARELLQHIHANQRTTTVEKVALIYKFTSVPTIKLELSRLKIDAQTYFSACIEGRSANLVQIICDHIFKQQKTTDYVHFLKQQVKP